MENRNINSTKNDDLSKYIKDAEHQIKSFEKQLKDNPNDEYAKERIRQANLLLQQNQKEITYRKENERKADRDRIDARDEAKLRYETSSMFAKLKYIITGEKKRLGQLEQSFEKRLERQDTTYGNSTRVQSDIYVITCEEFTRKYDKLYGGRKKK